MKHYWVDGQEVSRAFAALIMADNENIRKLAAENPDYREMKPVKITVSENENDSNVRGNDLK